MIAVLLAGCCLAAQPTFRSGVELVTIDVVATDRSGKPVHDLKAADFELSLALALSLSMEDAPVPWQCTMCESYTFASNDLRIGGRWLCELLFKQSSHCDSSFTFIIGIKSATAGG